MSKVKTSKVKTSVAKAEDTAKALRLSKTNFLGTLRTSNEQRFNVYATVGRESVLLFPIAPSGKQLDKSTAIKIADLSAKIRRRLGC